MSNDNSQFLAEISNQPSPPPPSLSPDTSSLLFRRRSSSLGISPPPQSHHHHHALKDPPDVTVTLTQQDRQNSPETKILTENEKVMGAIPEIDVNAAPSGIVRDQSSQDFKTDAAKLAVAAFADAAGGSAGTGSIRKTSGKNSEGGKKKIQWIDEGENAKSSLATPFPKPPRPSLTNLELSEDTGYDSLSGSEAVTPASSRPSTPDSDIDIMEGETDGLPRRSGRPRTFTREGAALVNNMAMGRGAIGGLGGLGGGSLRGLKGLGGNSRFKAAAREARLQARKERERERAAGYSIRPRERRGEEAKVEEGEANGSPSAGGGREGEIKISGGVMSALLKLYHRHQRADEREQSEGKNDEKKEKGRIEIMAEEEGREEMEREEREVMRDDDLIQETIPIPMMHSDSSSALMSRGDTLNSAYAYQSSDNLRTEKSTSPNENADASPTNKKRRSKTIKQLWEELEERIEEMRDSDRPAAARSKAGVFGALSASAMGLAGTASPVANSVAPAPHKKGYRVSRYKPTPMPMTTTSSLGSSEHTSPIQTENTRSAPLPGEEKDYFSSRLPSHTDPLHKAYSSSPMLSKVSKDSNGSYNLKEKRKGNQSPSFPLPSIPIRHAFDVESDLRNRIRKTGYSTPSYPGTPDEKGHSYSHSRSESVLGWFGGSEEKEKEKKRKKKKKSMSEEIFITMHVAAILQRQDFILKLARALMMFGAPSHRLESQIQSTAKVLDLQCQVIYIYNIMIISFQDEEAHVSETRIIKQNSALDLGKLTQISLLHYEVCHDQIGVDEASMEISRLMQAKPLYGTWSSILIGGLCSVMICVPSFNASFIDLLVCFPLGCFLVASQSLMAAKSQMLSSIFEIVIAAIISFTAAALASTELFCYAAITSASIVLILPGWPVCSASLELQNRSVVSGSVRLVWAIIYSLLLGFGISLGAQFWELFSNEGVLYGSDNSCSMSHMNGDPDAPWWRKTISLYTAFLFVPGFPFFLSLRNQSPIFRRELFVSIVISCVGWVTNHYAARGFPGRADVTSACGAFAVGLLGNLWGKLQQGTSFIVTVVPVLFQLPSGLSNGGLLNFAVTTDNSTASFDSGFTVAEQLITVSIGLTVGLFFSSLLVYPMGKKRGGVVSF